MKISISNQVFKKFPKLNLGIVIAKGISNKGSDKKIHHLLEEVEELIKLDFTPENVAKHPLISQWRAAYSEFGAKPSSYLCSVEALMRRILKGDKIPKINKAVDISNYLSLKHLVPVGVNDLDKIDGDISLSIAKGNEPFTPLGSKKKEKPDKGEIIYKDSKEVLCRRWNWRDSDKTKVTEKTKDVIYYIDALPPVNKTKLKEMLRDLIELIEIFCSAKETEIYVLDSENNEMEI